MRAELTSTAFKAQMGKGRTKGVPNKITPEMKRIALFLVKNSAMEKAELLAKLSQQARASVVPHLKKHADGSVYVDVDLEEGDTLREVTVREGPLNLISHEPQWTETKIKVADPVPPLQTIARIYGLEKAPEPAGGTKVWIQILLQNISDGNLDRQTARAAARAALREE